MTQPPQGSSNDGAAKVELVPEGRTTYLKDRQGLRGREQQRWVTSEPLLAAVVKVELLDRSSLRPPRRQLTGSEKAACKILRHGRTFRPLSDTKLASHVSRGDFSTYQFGSGVRGTSLDPVPTADKPDF